MKHSVHLFAAVAFLFLLLCIPSAAAQCPTFSLDDVEAMFQSSEQTLTEAYGFSGEISEISFDEGPILTLHAYPSSRYYFEASSGYLYAAYICDHALPHSRDIRIGDPVQTVLQRYAQMGTAVPESEACAVLYNIENEAYSYGRIFYNGNAIEKIVFCYDSITLTYVVADDIVSEIQYEIRL